MARCWLLVNEGNTPIKTRLTLPVDAPLCRYDLWNGQPCACPAERTAKGACLPLELPARGSLLLFTCTAQESEALPLPPTYLSLAAPAFSLADEDAAHLTKTYRATLQITATELQTATPLLTLPGQEMAELTVNGQPAGVSFWPPHKFPLAGLLTPGENALTLTLTGSPANRYGKHPVLRAGKINRFFHSTGGIFMSVCTPKSFDLTGKVASSPAHPMASALPLPPHGELRRHHRFQRHQAGAGGQGPGRLQGSGINAHGYVCDVTNEDAVNEMVKKITEEVGHINVLVNNAGIIKRIPMIEMTAAQFRQVIDVDLNAPFIVAKAVIPDMIEQGGGKIINICSMMSELGRETVSAYAAAKGGLKMLTKNIASEYGKYNIQCNGIGPGYIATPQTAPLREIQPDGSRHPFDQFIVAKTPAERWGEAEDLGGPAVFLASEASDFVNGLILYVDGGILAYIASSLGKTLLRRCSEPF